MGSLPDAADPTAEQQHRFEGLGRLGFAISSAGVREMLTEIVERVTPLMGPGIGLSVVLWNSADETFETSASTVRGQEQELAARRVRRSTGASRWIIDHNETLVIHDIDQDPFGANPMLREFGLHTYVGIPIPGSAAPLGVLYAMAPTAGSFDAVDLDLLTVVAARASGAIEVSAERDRTVAMLQRSRALHAIAATLNSDAPLGARLERVCATVRRTAGATAAAVAPHRSIADVLARAAIDGPTLRAAPRTSADGLASDLGYADGALVHPFGGEDPAGWFVVNGNTTRPSDLRRFLDIVGEQIIAALHRERDLQDLHASNAALQDFAHVVSHDLKTPLTSIIGFVDLLRERLSASADETTLDFLRRTDSSARRLATIIDALLEHATQRGQSLAIDAVDLTGVVSRVLDSLDAQIEITDAHVAVAPDLPIVTGDSAAIGIAVQNLVANALKYTRGDDPPQVRLFAEGTSERVQLIVADQGPGIPPDERDKVFGLFERGADPAAPGLGIGLATARALISRMHGAVWLEDNEPYGVRAIIELPAAADAEA